MTLSAEQILENWNKIIEYIEKYISSPRKEKLLKFYNKHSERLMLMPAAHKKEYHNCMPGGYIDHVVRVIECSLKINEVWNSMGSDSSTYTLEELVFSALNHDLGKMGNEDEQSYIPQTDAWRRDKLGEEYMFNDKVQFASVPDLGLWLLQQNDIKYTFNEMITIQTHDGLYDEANKKYLMSWAPETKLRTNLPLIVHQGDLMAAKIEFDNLWIPLLKERHKNTDSKKIETKNDKFNKLLNDI